MWRWAKPGQDREQLVLFTQRLDDAIPDGHTVRLFDEILRQLDFSAWEAKFRDWGPGRPPIHPRVLAGVILYGLLTRIRSSRALEDALVMRIDFRWLAEGRTIDHTTLSEFRRQHGPQLQELFVQTVLVAQNLKLTSLERMAFDGTRIRANNARSAARTPERLKELRAELQQKFDEFAAAAEAEEARQEEQLIEGASPKLPDELADAKRRSRRIEKALEEIDRLESAGEKTPKRIPLTDPDSRITPNKDGGFAPNFTSVASVDVESGFIVTNDVIPGTNEDQHLAAAVDAMERDFGTKPKDVLADGLFPTGPNLEAMEERDVNFYSPVQTPVQTMETNPAVRDDPTQPVPESQWPGLPTRTVGTQDGKKQKQLTKAAFVYDAEQNCYYCPQGEPLNYQRTTTEKTAGGERKHRQRYEADAAACAECPLKSLCVKEGTANREVSRDQFDPHRERQAQRMAQAESQAIYAQRGAVCERPFAVIKQHFGARQFLLRGLDAVRVEWRWLTTAFNLQKLLSHLKALAPRAGP